MNRKKIIILVVIIAAAAAAYYFYAKGVAAEGNGDFKPMQPNFDKPTLPEPKAPIDPNAGKMIFQDSKKDVARYYANNPLENPFINPIIGLGFIFKRLKKKK